VHGRSEERGAGGTHDGRERSKERVGHATGRSKEQASERHRVGRAVREGHSSERSEALSFFSHVFNFLVCNLNHRSMFSFTVI
jgi:hypothetical protein